MIRVDTQRDATENISKYLQAVDEPHRHNVAKMTLKSGPCVGNHQPTKPFGDSSGQKHLSLESGEETGGRNGGFEGDGEVMFSCQCGRWLYHIGVFRF